jgi:hypothetical protein
MHDPEKSDSGRVAAKPTNKAGRPAAEPVEPRPGTKGNADQQSTHRTQSPHARTFPRPGRLRTMPLRYGPWRAISPRSVRLPVARTWRSTARPNTAMISIRVGSRDRPSRPSIADGSERQAVHDRETGGAIETVFSSVRTGSCDVLDIRAAGNQTDDLLPFSRFPQHSKPNMAHQFPRGSASSSY